MTWSSVDLASQCLGDESRTNQIVEAIREVVGEGDQVIDIGTGTGVLAVAAAGQTTGMVDAVEIDPDVVWFLLRHKHSLPKNLNLIGGDARTLSERRKYDVAIVELIDTWLLCEDLVPVLIALFDSGSITTKTKYIPLSYSFHLELGHCDFNWCQGNLQFPYYEWPFYQAPAWKFPAFDPAFQFHNLEKLTMSNVASKMALGIKKTVIISKSAPDSNRTVNAARLSGTISLTSSNEISSTQALNAPVVLPLRDNFDLNVGCEIGIEAEFSKGFRSLKIISGSDALY